MIPLKNLLTSADNPLRALFSVARNLGGTFMSKKHEGNGQKKKLTKKEIKAQNHAKLMSNKGSTSNVVDINAYKDQNKKAA